MHRKGTGMFITNRQLEKLAAIFSKLGKTTDPIPRWNIAIRLRSISACMGDLVEAKKPSKAVEELLGKIQMVYEKYGTYMGDTSGMRKYSIPADRQEDASREIRVIHEDNADVLIEASRHKEAVAKLLEEKVELQLGPIEYAWCGESINADEIAFLMDLQLMVMDT
jgi:hypothetical protein